MAQSLVSLDSPSIATVVSGALASGFSSLKHAATLSTRVWPRENYVRRRGHSADGESLARWEAVPSYQPRQTPHDPGGH